MSSVSKAYEIQKEKKTIEMKEKQQGVRSNMSKLDKKVLKLIHIYGNDHSQVVSNKLEEYKECHRSTFKK